jgi:hypothetical protein
MSSGLTSLHDLYRTPFSLAASTLPFSGLRPLCRQSPPTVPAAHAKKFFGFRAKRGCNCSPFFALNLTPPAQNSPQRQAAHSELCGQCRVGQAAFYERHADFRALPFV